jgi:dTDP-4-amino-4,6-dideoxygalactose transaminase
MDSVLLEEAIKDRLRKTGKAPKAIVSVHLYGMPAKMNEIMEVAHHYNIPILEDAAEAIGSELNGQKCGTFGHLGVLSFNGNKMITTSGGGALVCRTEEEAKLAKFYATQARDTAPHYQHSHIGYNYRMSNICAGIGRGQMFVLEEHIARRRAIHNLYVEWLKDVSGITVMQNPAENHNSNFWLTCILVDPQVAGKTREDIRLQMEKEHIETRPLWKPMHLQPVFADAPFYGNGTSEHLFDRGLCLPSGPTLTDEDIKRVAGVIKRMIIK